MAVVMGEGRGTRDEGSSRCEGLPKNCETFFAMVGNNPQKTAWHNVVKVAIGIALGLMLIAIPLIPIVVPVLSIALLIVLAIRVRRLGWRCDAVAVLAVCIVLAVCAFLPVKQLDVEVGPIAYGEMSLFELCNRLRADHGIICRPPYKSGQTHRLTFFTDRPLSRRKVLEKLSRDANMPLHIGYCGTNATILFGGYPSFTYLEGE